MLKSKYVLLFFTVFSIIIVISGLILKVQSKKFDNEVPLKDSGKVEMMVKDKKIFIEIASTNEQMQKGLSGRDPLAEDEGMLFVFPEKDTLQSFWMKDMKFDLDFIWINDDKVVQTHENIKHPSPGTPDSKLEILTPKTPIDSVLEVNAGFVEKNNIKEGDSVVINF